MGYVEPPQDTTDPFASTSEDSSSDDGEELETVCSSDEAENSSASSISAPAYELIDSDPPSC